jgi:excinuclease UvrABC nuclease subunit
VALAEKLDTLPLRPGVYLFKDVDGETAFIVLPDSRS